jgi:hypothetical protein
MGESRARLHETAQICRGGEIFRMMDKREHRAQHDQRQARQNASAQQVADNKLDPANALLGIGSGERR